MIFNLFEGESQLLPAFSRPYPDEWLSSWLARIAFDHGLTVHELCILKWERTSWQSKDMDQLADEDSLQLLAIQTNCSYEEVKNASLLYYEDRLFDKRILLRNAPDKWVLPRWDRNSFRRKSGVMYCPSCFSSSSKQVYFKKQWRLGISFVCPDCECYLMEVCPHCKKYIWHIDAPIDPSVRHVSDHFTTCWYCHKDIRECEVVRAPEDMVTLQKQLYDILDHGYDERIIYPVPYFNSLYHISSLLSPHQRGLHKIGQEKLLAFIQYVFTTQGLSSLYSNKYKTEGPVQYLSIHKRALIIKLAHWFLADWPSRFLRYCKRFDLRNVPLLYYFKDAPFWFWEPVYSNLPYPPIYLSGEIPFGLKSIFEKPRIQRMYQQKKNRVNKSRKKYHGLHVEKRSRRNYALITKQIGCIG